MRQLPWSLVSALFSLWPAFSTCGGQRKSGGADHRREQGAVQEGTHGSILPTRERAVKHTLCVVPFWAHNGYVVVLAAADGVGNRVKARKERR